MASVPQAERPPKGLDSFWTHTWRHALKVLKEQGTWAWEQKPLLDEYVLALREARSAREAAELAGYRESEGGVSAHPGFVQADRAVRRAVLLADKLMLTPEMQRKIGHQDDERTDPFSAIDELAEKRATRAAG